VREGYPVSGVATINATCVLLATQATKKALLIDMRLLSVTRNCTKLVIMALALECSGFWFVVYIWLGWWLRSTCVRACFWPFGERIRFSHARGSGYSCADYRAAGCDNRQPDVACGLCANSYLKHPYVRGAESIDPQALPIKDFSRKVFVF